MIHDDHVFQVCVCALIGMQCMNGANHDIMAICKDVQECSQDLERGVSYQL